MPTLKLAHVRQQGQDMILFPLAASFGQKTVADQRAALCEFERRAHAAGLRGHAAAVWDDGHRVRTLGPSHWRGFLSTIGVDWVLANVNRQINW